jgi:hypothetical protein
VRRPAVGRDGGIGLSGIDQNLTEIVVRIGQLRIGLQCLAGILFGRGQITTPVTGKGEVVEQKRVVRLPAQGLLHVGDGRPQLLRLYQAQSQNMVGLSARRIGLQNLPAEPDAGSKIAALKCRNGLTGQNRRRHGRLLRHFGAAALFIFFAAAAGTGIVAFGFHLLKRSTAVRIRLTS